MIKELISAKQFYELYSKEAFEAYYFNHTKAELLEYFNINRGTFDTIKAHYKTANKPISNKKQNTFKTIISTYTKDQFLEYFAEHSLEEIYTYFNISRNTLYKIKNYWQIPDKTKAQRAQINTRIYGVTNPMQLPEVKAKLEATMLNTYGSTNYAKSMQAKENRIASQEKAKSTCLMRYGNEYYQRTESAKIRAHETRKRNKSYSKSSFEDLFFKLVSEQITENAIIQQYRNDARYPFACDFYVPVLDLFIEINAHFTHGKHPFNSQCEEDIKQLELWKVKQEKYPAYKTAIDVWTRRDPLKMKTAKDNNLNYICLYDKQSIRNFAEGLTDLLKFINSRGCLIS
jgi:hypothetical protein